MRHHRKGRNPDADKLIIYHNPTGSATFDPTITTSRSTTVIWQTEAGATVTTGTTHNLSYTPTAGAKVCKVTVRGGLGLVTGIDCNTDAIVGEIKNLQKCTELLSYTCYGNSAMVTYLSKISKKITFVGPTTPVSIVYGTIAELRSAPVVSYYMAQLPLITGSLSDLNPALQTARFYGCPGIIAASIARLVAIRDLRIYSMGWNQVGVDTVISSMWGARANYTYATPSLQIGGTNAAPSGSYIAPEEGINWHRDSEEDPWIPLTGKAMIYDLINDVNAEGFNLWAITYTS